MRKYKSKMKLWLTMLLLCPVLVMCTSCRKEDKRGAQQGWEEVWTAAEPQDEGRKTPHQEAEPAFVPDITDIPSGAYQGLTAGQKNLYNALKQQIRKVANGKKTTSVFCVSMETYGFTEPVDEDTVEEVTAALYADLPYDLYWYDSRNGVQIYSVNDIIREFRYFVSGDYSVDGKEKTFATDLPKIAKAAKIAENAKKVVEENEGKSDIEKLRAYKDYICAQAEYDHIAFSDSDGASLNSWQLINVFDNDPDTNVVCEGYAKAFQYLCDLSCFTSEVMCCRVSGMMSSTDYDKEDFTMSAPSGHAWNIVRTGGESYLVDVTNCDDGKFGDFTVDENGELLEGAGSGDLLFMLNLSGLNGNGVLPDAITVSGSAATGYTVDRSEISFEIGGEKIRTFFRHVAKYMYDDTTTALYRNEILSLGTDG